MKLKIILICATLITQSNGSTTTNRTKRSIGDFSGFGLGGFNPLTPAFGNPFSNAFGGGFPGPFSSPFPAPYPAFGAQPFLSPVAPPSVVPIIICPPGPSVHAGAIPVAAAPAAGLAGVLQTLFARKAAAIAAPPVAIPVPSPYPVPVKVPVPYPVDRPVPVAVYKSRDKDHDHDHHRHHELVHSQPDPAPEYYEEVQPRQSNVWQKSNPW